VHTTLLLLDGLPRAMEKPSTSTFFVFSFIEHRSSHAGSTANETDRMSALLDVALDTEEAMG